MSWKVGQPGNRIGELPIGGLFILRWETPTTNHPLRAVFLKINVHECRCLVSATDQEQTAPVSLAHYVQNHERTEIVDPGKVEGFQMLLRMGRKHAALKLIGLETDL